MKPISITLHNFGSHRDTVYTPIEHGLVMVTGDTGSGKSTLLSDSQRFAFFGTARLRAPHLLRRGASDMSVAIEFEHGGARYRVVRGYGSKAGGKSFAALAIQDTDEAGHLWRPLTGDTIADTNAAIAALLRLDQATFQTSAMLVQRQISAFADASPIERKRIFATALNIEHPWTEAEAAARERARRLESTAAQFRVTIERLTDQLAYRPELQDDEAGYRHRLDEITIEAGLVEVELAEHRAALVTLAARLADASAAESDVARLTREIEAEVERYKGARRRQHAAHEADERADATLAQASRIEAAVKQVPLLEAELAVARSAVEAHRALEAEGERATSDRRMTEHDLHAATERWESLKAQTADTTICPECGKTIPAGGAALEDRILAAYMQVVAVREALEALPPLPELPAAPLDDPWEISQRLTEAQGLAASAPSLADARRVKAEATSAFQDATRDAEAAEEAGKAARAALDVAQARVTEQQPLRDERASHDAEVTRLDERRHALEEDARKVEGSRAAAAARLKQLDAAAKERDALTVKLEAASVTLARLGRLVTAFSPKGIPARIIDSAVPDFAADANALLGVLAPGMSLDIRTQRATAKGDGIIEALDIIVRDETGEALLESFSGGEQTAISLALAVANSRAGARRSGAALRSMTIDEPDGLSPAWRQRLGLALKTMTGPGGQLDRLSVITHTPDLEDFADEVVHLSRNGDGSHVELVS